MPMTGKSAERGRAPSPRENAVLSPLPVEEYQQLEQRLQVLDLSGHELLLTANAPIEDVYFPLDALVSLVSDTGQGTMVEVGAIGNEGMLGIPVFLGAPTSPTSAYCQVPGHMAHLPAAALQTLLPHTPTLNDRLRLFSNVMMAQLGLNAACNRAHAAEQRCARWLLLTADRVGRDEFDLTHQFLAQMLGVRRATVSETAQALAEAGLIRYQRGHLILLDRTGLAERACTCYESLRTQLKTMTD